MASDEGAGGAWRREVLWLPLITPSRMGCDGSSQVLLRTGFLFSWSYQFTRGIIKNKTSVSMSLVT